MMDEPAEVYSMTVEDVDREALQALRAPFPPEAIDKLPRAVDKSASRQSCRECGGYHKPAKIHLDYVGHAQLTARLLDVDPEWTWEPVAYTDDGLPALMRDSNGNPMGLWIRLTVAGMTRLGFGECPASKGADGVKEAIGDALRNAAMRFGAALDLWAKGDLPGSRDDGEAGRHETLTANLEDTIESYPDVFTETLDLDGIWQRALESEADARQELRKVRQAHDAWIDDDGSSAEEDADGPVCADCGGSLAGASVAKRDGAYVHKGGCPDG